MKKTMALVMSIAMIACLIAGCGSSSSTSSASAASSSAASSAASTSSASSASKEASVTEEPTAEPTEEPVEEAAEPTTLYIDIAASLEAVFSDVIIPAFEAEYPDIDVVYNAGSSGKLLTGIEEANGVGHDLFFSAGKSQVKTLDETDGLVIADSTVNLLKNELCLVKGNDVETAVTSWDTINMANSAAICAGSVPVGKYTRIALVSLGFLPEAETPADYTTEDISAALGGMEIDEADDVEVAASKAVEQSVEVATIYYSDYYNHQDDLTIIDQDDGTLTGDIIYPVCLVNNSEATDEEKEAAELMLEFLQTEDCLEAFEEYCFIVNYEGLGIEAPVAQLDATTITIDIAASLEAVFADVIIPAYKEIQPNVEIVYNTGSSGKLLTGIEEANGIGHDLFFSAGKSQVKTLDETDGLVIADSTVNLLKNELCLVKGNDVETAVTGWDTINQAKTAAICAGSVPVGKYTRIALVSLGFLPEAETPADYTTEEISAALGGVEIDEADDVEVAASKAVEQSVEVATIYYSDYYNHQNDLTIIAQDDGTLTGDIIYPVCLVNNAEADAAELAAAQDFLAFLQTDACLAAFEEYCFIINQ